MRIHIPSLLIICLPLLNTCGRPTDLFNPAETQSSFRSKVKLGRSVQFARSESGNSFALDSGIVHSKQDKYTGAIVAMEFDSSKSDLLTLEQLKDGALNVIDSYHNELQIKLDELKAPIAPKVIDDRLAFVQFQRTLNDLLVKNAFVDVIYAKDSNGLWKLIEISNNSFANRGLIKFDRTSVSPDILKSAFDGEFEVAQSEELIFPKLTSDGNIELHQANVFKLMIGPEVQYVVTVSQHTQEILESYSPRMSAVTTIQAPGFPRSYMDGAQPFALPDAEITMNGKTVKTNLLGEFDLTTSGPANVRLYSSRVDAMKSVQTLKFDLTLQAGKPLIIADAVNQRGVNAFLSVHRVNQFVRKHLLETQAAILKTQVNLSIDVAGSCNAFYSNTTINLYNSGNGCANMATVNDVIYHEWGHGLDDYTGRQVGITDDAFSEGIGDILGSYLTGSSNMATGFYLNKVEGIRQLQNTKKYPADLEGEPHADGLIIGGAFWDLRSALVARYGETKGSYIAEEYFTKHLLTTDSYKESYQSVLRLDDNDGNPATQSPNFCLITEAFAKHGLATANPGCVDNFDSSKAVPSIALGIVSGSFEGSSLMIATDTVANVFLCSDAKEKCLNPNAKLTAATLEGSVGARVTYVAQNYPRLKEEQMLTIILKDSSNKMIGTRSFKFMKR